MPAPRTGSIQASMSSEGMQYAHLPRDDSNGSTPFQSHQSLGQALGNHLGAPPAPYPRPTDAYRISPSPSPIHPNGTQHNVPPSHSPLTFALNPSPTLKRKPGDTISQISKRRRPVDDEPVDSFDADAGGQGAKHWTDDEKSKLFNWLMGAGQDEHWNALRATKNSCLRECSIEIFQGRKTYQALKGCYERNFNLFKQIYAFESFHRQGGINTLASLGEADRLREYERRLVAARKAMCDVGNITARTIDHWHRMGWYDLFYRRWHGDPATTRPIARPSLPSGPDDDGEDEQIIDFAEPLTANGMSHDRAPSLPFHIVQMPPVTPTTSTAPPPSASAPPTVNTPPLTAPAPGADQPVNLTVTQGMLQTYLQFLQVQTQTGKMKLEYLRRREEREERESQQRRELERLRLERETAEFEHTKHAANTKQKADRAIELLGNPMADSSIKQAAGDYLKKLFTQD